MLSLAKLSQSMCPLVMFLQFMQRFALVILLSVTSNVWANFVAWDTKDGQEAGEWLSRDSQHFTIHYRSNQQALADKSLAIAEVVHTDLTQFFDYEPSVKTEMVLIDDFDFSNGWATFFPFAQIRLFTSPPDQVNSLEVNDDWLHTLIRHEYVHILHMELGRGAPKELRNVFGRFLALFPHALTPSFMLEGLAVYLETDHEKGYGRLQGSYYDMLMRMEVEAAEGNPNGLKSLGEVAQPLRKWPLGSNYLYGSYFFQFLDEQYGRDKIQQYLTRYSGELIPAVMQNSQMRNATGSGFSDLWQEYRNWLITKFSAKLDVLLKQQKNTGERASFQQAYAPLNLDESSSVGSYFYFVKNTGEDIPTLMKVGTERGQKEHIAEVKNILDVAINRQGKVVASRLIPTADGRGWADVFILDNGDWQRLTEGQRFRRVLWLNEQQLLVSRINNGLSELHLLSIEKSSSWDSESQLIWQGDDLGIVLGEFSLAPNGKSIIASMKRPLQGWNLERLDISSINSDNLKWELEWKKVTNTKAVENSPFYIDDQRVIYSADYDGVYNLMLIDLQTLQITQLTSMVGGAFSPKAVDLNSDNRKEIYFQSYGDEGFEFRKLDLSHVLNDPVATFSTQSLQGQYNYPDVVNNKEAELGAVEAYQPWSTLAPKWWFPSWSVLPEYSQFGLQTSGSDALARHNYSLFFGYDPDNQLADVGLTYLFDNRYQFSFVREHDYFDINDDDKSDYIAENDIWSLSRLNLFNAFEDQLSFNLNLLTERKSAISRKELLRPQCVNFNNPAHKTCEKTLVGAALRFDSRRGFLNAPGFSDGRYWDLVIESNDVLASDLLASDFSGNIIQGQWQEVFDLPGRRDISFTVLAGQADKNSEPFIIGGESIIKDSSLFGRDEYALRGYDSAVQGGNNVQVNRLAFDQSLGRIEEGWGIWPVGAGDITGRLFVDHGAAWFDGNSQDYLTGVGVEVNVEAVAFYRLLLPMTFGYAKGLDSTLGEDRAYFTISLPLQ